VNLNQTSAGSAKTSTGSRGGAERSREQSAEPSLRTRVRHLFARVRSRFDKPAASAAAVLDRVPVLGGFLRLRVAWIVVIFAVGLAGGATWQSYGGVAGRSGTAERLKAMSLALATARKNLDKLASDLSRLEVQGRDGSRRRSVR
jgi:hypothetical protein